MDLNHRKVAIPDGTLAPVSKMLGAGAACLFLLAVTVSSCGTAVDSPNGGGGGTSASGGGPGTGLGGNSPASGGGTGQGGNSGSGNTGGANSGGSSSGTGGAAGGTGGASGGTGGSAGGGTGGAAGAGGGTADSGTPQRDGGSGGATVEAGPTRPVPGLPEYWVSPTGRDTNPGTQALPFATIVAAHNFVAAGSTIWVMPGTYSASYVVSLFRNGTAAAPISVKAVAGGARPIMDFAPQMPRNTGTGPRGFEVMGNYWVVAGLDIRNAADNCIHITGSNNTIDNVVVHGCGDTGIQITLDDNMAGDPTKGANNLIRNCDSFGNLDVVTNGENADGFAAKLAIGDGNVFDGCRAWNNADDGWDLFAANHVVAIRNCWAFSNGKTLNGAANPAGDGNGFKLGGAQSGTDLGGAVHIVTNSFAFDNLACGFTQNNNPRTPSLNMCGSLRNPNGNYCGTLTQAAANNAFTMTAAQALATQRNADGSLPAIR